MIKVVCLDNQIGMKKIKTEVVNCVITSPPYNVGDEQHNPIKYNLYDDVKITTEYIAWLKSIFTEVYRIMRPDGRVCINVGSKKNGRIPTQYFIMRFMQDIGFRFFTEIIWDKGHSSRNTSFGSYLKPSCPSFITTFEYILIFYKENRKLESEYHRTTETDLTKDEFVKWSRAMWSFPYTKNKVHPASFPLELPYRLIKMLTYKGDLVLDPFMGIGTTGMACEILGRDFVGFDIDKKYVNYFNKGKWRNVNKKFFKE